MDYWAKDIYSWGIFSVEVYPRSSIAIQRTVGCREFPVHSMIYRWVNKFRTHGNIFCGSTPPEHCLQRPLHSAKCTAWFQTWHHWTILIRGRQRPVCDNQHRAICPGAWQVLDSTWSTERGLQGPPVVPAGWCHLPHLKRIIGMATAAFLWPTDQPQVWPAAVAAFTGLERPRFLYMGIP